MLERSLGLALFLATSLAIVGSTAWAEAAANKPARMENCPAAFDLVDLGRWTRDDEGNAAFGYGGLQYEVTPPNRQSKDFVLCIHPDDLGVRVQLLDRKPVSLVQHFRESDMGYRYILKFHGDYVHDGVRGYIQIVSPGASRLRRSFEKKRQDFLGWLEVGDDARYVIARGADNACLFDPDNPALSGEGSYTCLVTFDKTPFPQALFRCGRWVGGRFAEFFLSRDIFIRLEGGISVIGMRRLESIASPKQSRFGLR